MDFRGPRNHIRLVSGRLVRREEKGRAGGDADAGKVHREGEEGSHMYNRGGGGAREGRDRGRQLKRRQEGNECKKKKKKKEGQSPLKLWKRPARSDRVRRSLT